MEEVKAYRLIDGKRIETGKIYQRGSSWDKGEEDCYILGINNWIVHNSSYLRIISCLLVMIFVCYYGYRQPHRSFLHSFLGLFILSFLCYFAFGNIVIPFSIGLITHIILDLFNIKGLRLFYPLINKLK